MVWKLNPENIRRLLNTPPARRLMRRVSRRTSSGRPLVEEILNSFSENMQLRYIQYYLLVLVILKYMGVDRQTAVQNVFSLPYYRKALSIVAASVAQYGVTTPQLFASPLLVVWNFTNACNLRCRHCYQDARRPLSDELSLDKQLEVVEQLDYYSVPTVALSGGEPLASKNFWRVAEELKRKGIYLSVATNGTLLSAENVSRLKEIGVDYVEVSLDSADPGFHDQFRGIPGIWGKTVQGIRNCLEQGGIKVGLAATVTRQNYDQVPGLIELSKDLGVDMFYVFNFIPTGRAAEIVQSDLTPWMREELLGILYEELRKGEIGVMSTMPQYGRHCLQRSSDDIVITTHYSYEKGKIARNIAEYLGGCGAGRAYVALQPNGMVTPCVFMPIPLGSLRDQSLGDIWNNSPVLGELRNRKGVKVCGSCEFSNICGGCRARAYGYFQDYLAPDPGCVRNADTWEEISGGFEETETNGKSFVAKSGSD